MKNSETSHTGGNVDKDGYTRTAEAFRNDLDFYYDRNGCVRTELLYKKRIMNIPELINKIEKVDEQKLGIEELIQINNKNDWKHIFRI